MSFSSQVKEELCGRIPDGRHCRIAEIAAILFACGEWQGGAGDGSGLFVHTENQSVARKYFTLLKKTFNIEGMIRERRSEYLQKSRVYRISVEDRGDAERILAAGGFLRDGRESGDGLSGVSRLIVQRDCCKRAFLRGMFLAAGSISDPEKSYHLEIVCATEGRAEFVQSIMKELELDARCVARKKNYIVYLKEGSQIVELLGVMGAGISLMNLENIRIRKEISNNVNRKVNCETANITKTVSASVRQAEDIRYIQSKGGLSVLPEALYETAVLRLRYPEASLKELGAMMDPPVGKSGVNHRLRKLGRIAEELQGNKEDYYD